MGIMDSVKKAMQGRSGKVGDAVDTAARKIDERTAGKYTDKLTSSADKVKGAAERLDRRAQPVSTDDNDSPDTTGEAPTGPTAIGHMPGPPPPPTEGPDEDQTGHTP